MRRIIWRAGRVAPSLCLKIPLLWLVLMLAAHWQTDWLVWEKEEGKGDVCEWKKKSPSSDWQAGRTDGAQFFQAFFFRAGRYRVPFSTSSLLLPNSEFQGPPDSDLWTPWRSILPPFKWWRRTPPPPLLSHTHTSPDAHQRAPSSAQSHNGRARAPSTHLLSITCGAGGGLY